MQHRRFKDLGITSSKKPFNAHLFWEHSTYGLILVDSGDQTKLFISTDKGDNWSEIDLSDNTNSFKIQVGWLDGNDLWLVMCDNDGIETEFEVCFVELDDSNDCNPVDVQATSAGDSMLVYDIFKLGSDFYVYWNDNIGVGELDWITEVTVSPFVAKDSINTEEGRTSHATVVGTKAYWWKSSAPFNFARMVLYDSTIPAITSPFNVINGYFIKTDTNFRGQSYDGSDVLQTVLEKNADNKNYLINFSIGGDAYTIGAEYNIILQLDRNNSGIVPNELEKAFSSDAVETVYEIKARRGGIRQLQNMSAITDAVIIAITDNFLMNDDGDMFEFVDVTNEISTILYNDGIVGIPKRGNFTVHPDFHINWNKGDSIKIYDQYDQLEFHGLITDKNRNSRGIYIFKIDSFTNEIFRKTYSTTYSGDDLDTKQKDIIDNACDFCYRSSSIVGTTTTFNYVYNRALIYLFWLGRRLERQVPYVEPDGKIWTKAHDGLVRNDMIYPGTYNFKEEADGTSGNDIDFVDGSVTGANTTAQIITSHNGHRKVLELHDNDAGAVVLVNNNISNEEYGTIEFFWTISDATLRNPVSVSDGGTVLFALKIDGDQFQYFDGAYHNVGLVPIDGTKYHVRIDFECTAGGYSGLAQYSWKIFIGDIGFGDYNFWNNQPHIDKFQIETRTADSGYFCNFASFGYSWDPAYTVGDNKVAWDINNHWQDVQFIDIPSIEETIQGFFDGNTGITRNTVRYRDNAQTIRPIAATRDPIEQLQGILPLNEFRDPKIEEDTEANQLGDNRYAIWSTDTLFLGLRVLGQGYLQPGKTIHVENTGQITVAESNLLLLSFVRDPKNDVYSQMILSDNIIFPSEFTNLDNTSPQQTHTGIVQSFENQADIIAHLTPEGGLALRLTNKTGVNSVKGTIIEAHAGIDNAFRVCDANSVESFGIVYEDGIADGSECLVVVGGRCQVLLKDATASTRNNWVGVSDVAGRADATGASPPAQPDHFKEVGHCIESKGADTDVLAFMIMHHN